MMKYLPDILGNDKMHCRITLLASVVCLLAGHPAHAQNPTPALTQNSYTVRADEPAQVIWGLGYEIQSDSIGSGNNGLPDEVVAVPHDLVPSERKRLYHDMLHGFRYCRLALGLYVRGTDTAQKQFVERYPGQMADLAEMAKESGIEGFDVEYWSPAPYWKSTGNLNGFNGTLKSYDPDFLDQFGDACVNDVTYLEQHGLHVVQWGLQNEPVVDHVGYSDCAYSPARYSQTFAAVAPKIHAAYPNVLIHATSWQGQGDAFGASLRANDDALKYIDAWTWHCVGANSSQQIDEAPSFNKNTGGKPVFNNEFEYFGAISDGTFINTAQSIMNWFTFENAPTWYWLHALKPTYNSEAAGYGLGFWRPAGDTNFQQFPQIQPGHWDYNQRNFNSIAGFLKYMPWNSRRLTVDENVVLKSNRILAFTTPGGNLVVVLTNHTLSPFTFNINVGRSAAFTGHIYTPTARDVSAGTLSGPTISPVLPPRSIEFWVQ